MIRLKAVVHRSTGSQHGVWDLRLLRPVGLQASFRGCLVVLDSPNNLLHSVSPAIDVLGTLGHHSRILKLIRQSEKGIIEPVDVENDNRLGVNVDLALCRYRQYLFKQRQTSLNKF